MIRISRPATLLASLFLAACAVGPTVRDLEGQRIGKPDWRPIAAEEARLAIGDTQTRVLAREKVELHSRYLERWSLEGGHLVYEALKGGGFGPESKNPSYLHRLYGDDPVLRRQGVRFDADDIVVRRNLTFVVAHSRQVTCFAFVSVFGETTIANSPGNRLLRGGICRPAQPRESPARGPDFIRLLETLRVEGRPVLGD